ncbi:hypothetical protein ACWGCW_12840 [Streptomyces sp. NPDC054933]
MIDQIGHIVTRLPHLGEPRDPSPPPECTVLQHDCGEEGCVLCEARDAIANGRDVLAEVEVRLMEARELLQVAALMGPAPHDVLVPYLRSPMVFDGVTPASGALVDAAYRTVQASQTLLWAAQGCDFRYLARASSHLTAAAYAAARVTDRLTVLDGIDDSDRSPSTTSPGQGQL